jgi:branched-chain amino acid aminotransferase
MTIQPTEKIWFDGALRPWHEAQVHVLTHALHFGSSVFEGIRAYHAATGTQIFRLRDHLLRLADSAKIYRMNGLPSVDELCDACCAVVRENGLRAAYIRPIAFHGFGSIGLDPGDAPVQLAIAAVEWSEIHGAGAIADGIDACVTSWQRLAPNTVPVLAKAGGNYLSSQLIHMEAVRHGYHEGIGLGPDGTLSEGAGENVFVVKNGVLRTPPVAGSMLAGITRDTVFELASDLDLRLVESAVPRELLYTADEVFMTGTAAEITPVRSIDQITVGTGRPGPVTRAVQAAFFGLFSGETPDRRGWLTPV